MAKIKNEEVPEAIGYCNEIIAHRHPKSGYGIPQTLSVDLMVLKRFLVRETEKFKDEFIELLATHGEMKVPGVRESAEVPKDSPKRGVFNVALMELNRREIEVPPHMCIARDKFQIRDDEGQWEEIQIGAVGALCVLLPKEESEAGTDESAPKKPAKKR